VHCAEGRPSSPPQAAGARAGLRVRAGFGRAGRYGVRHDRRAQPGCAFQALLVALGAGRRAEGRHEEKEAITVDAQIHSTRVAEVRLTEVGLEGASRGSRRLLRLLAPMLTTVDDVWVDYLCEAFESHRLDIRVPPLARRARKRSRSLLVEYM